MAITTMSFRRFKPGEEAWFRGYARRTYELFTPIQGIWHPVYLDDCVKMNEKHRNISR